MPIQSKEILADNLNKYQVLFYKKTKNKSGYTLLLLIVISSICLAIMIPAFNQWFLNFNNNYSNCIG